MCVPFCIYSTVVCVYTHITLYSIYLHIFARFLQRALFQIQTRSPWDRISSATETAFCSKQWSAGIIVPVYLHPIETTGGQGSVSTFTFHGSPYLQKRGMKEYSWLVISFQQTQLLLRLLKQRAPRRGDLQHKVRPAFKMLQKYIAVLLQIIPWSMSWSVGCYTDNILLN